jgi:energy-coupling factor transport system permease protein
VSAPDVLARPDVALDAGVARANPVAKLGVSVVMSLVLIITVDPVTAGTALAGELLALPWCGLGPRALLRRCWIVLAGALPAGLITCLYGVDSGAVLADLAMISVTEGSVRSGIAITLRITAIALPGVVLLATTDPTDLADALGQILRLRATFVLAALAAMRLVGLLARERETLALARRARGLGDDGPLGRLRTAVGQGFALLVLAIRRGAVLSTAMEARGFGAGGPAARRTWARPSRLDLADAALLLGGVLLGAVATAAGVLTGSWELVLS